MVLAAARVDAIQIKDRVGQRRNRWVSVMDYWLNGKCVTGNLLKLQDAGEIVLTAEVTNPGSLVGFAKIMFPDNPHWEMVQTVRANSRR